MTLSLVPIPPLEHSIREEAERIEHMLMVQRLGLYLNPDRRKQWEDSGYHAGFQQYVEEHPDEVVALNDEALKELAEKIIPR